VYPGRGLEDRFSAQNKSGDEAISQSLDFAHLLNGGGGDDDEDATFDEEKYAKFKVLYEKKTVAEVTAKKAARDMKLV
jgi:hypothetical protein